MATKFVPVTDHDTIYELWSAGLLYSSHTHNGAAHRADIYLKSGICRAGLAKVFMVARMDTCPRTNYMFKEITDLQEADGLWDLGLIYYVYDALNERRPVPDDSWLLDDSAMRKTGEMRAAYKPSRWYPECHRYAIRLEA